MARFIDSTGLPMLKATPYKAVCGVEGDRALFPINLGVMLLQPVIPQNHFVSQALYNVKQLLFIVVPNPEIHQGSFSKVLIEGAVP
jgi:hypothetical protein